MVQIIYEDSIKLRFFGLLALILDLSLCPLFLQLCWNDVIPYIFVNLSEITYRQAFIIRIGIYSITAIFGRIYRLNHEIYVKNFYISILKDTIENLNLNSTVTIV